MRLDGVTGVQTCALPIFEALDVDAKCRLEADCARVQALEEGRNATRVVHGCAITVHDVFREGTDIWLVMEYIPSRSMAQFLAEHGRLTPEQASSLGIQLGSTLAAMHAAGKIGRAHV